MRVLVTVGLTDAYALCFVAIEALGSQQTFENCLHLWVWAVPRRREASAGPAA